MPHRRKGSEAGHTNGHHSARTGSHNGSHHQRKQHRKRRRRLHVRNMVLAASAFLATSHGKPLKLKVTTSIASYSTRPATHYDVAVRPDPKTYEPIIQEAAAKHGLDPALIRAVMRFESAFRPLAVSPVGAAGLMQLMPSRAKEFGVRDIFDPYENIMAGSAYLRELLDRHHGKLELALASYNAGPGAVARYRGIPAYPETRRYVKKITGFLARNRDATDKRGD